MKPPWIVLVFGLAIGGLACALMIHAGGQCSGLKSDAPELGWLKTEYQLSDAEFTRFYDMHMSYLPQCKAMCRRIDQKNSELKKLLASASGVTPQIEQLLQESAQLRVECQQMMLAHFFAVSRTMPSEKGKRYLAWVQAQTIFNTNGPAMRP